MFQREAKIQIPPCQHGHSAGRLSKWLPSGLSGDQASLQVFGWSTKAMRTAMLQHQPERKPGIWRDLRILTRLNVPHTQRSGKRKKIQRIGHSLKFYIIKKKKNPHELVQSSPWIKKGKPSSFHEAILGHCTLESREGSLKGANTINVLAFAIFLNPGDKSGNFMSAGMRTIKAKWVAC